jgi:mannose-6-phosphate isomerase-like protein (cupin superfamily)
LATYISGIEIVNAEIVFLLWCGAAIKASAPHFPHPFSHLPYNLTMASTLPRKTTLQEAMSRLPGPNGERFSSILSHGSFEAEIYAPRGNDPQQPHTRDEVYIVVSGRGEFTSEGKIYPFEPHDVLFVPAGAEHRFTRFSDDLVVWAIFYVP